MSKGPTLALAVLMLTSLTAAAPQQAASNPGFVPGDLFYPFEKFVENIEVEMAGMIGGEDMRAKAIANNADERLAEAQKLRERNKSEKAAELGEEYEREMNKSREVAKKARDKNISKKIDEVSERNKEVLRQVRGKAPAPAKKGLDKAIENSDKKDRATPPKLRRETKKPEDLENKTNRLNRTGDDVADSAPEINAGKTDKKINRANKTNLEDIGNESSKELDDNKSIGPTGNSVAENPAGTDVKDRKEDEELDGAERKGSDEVKNQVQESQKPAIK